MADIPDKLGRPSQLVLSPSTKLIKRNRKSNIRELHGQPHNKSTKESLTLLNCELERILHIERDLLLRI